MEQAPPQFLNVGRGDAARSIACLIHPGRSPGIVWLQGFRSEMTSLKATALARWAHASGHACTRFDYSGHGQSPGRFADATLSDWLEECTTVFSQMTSGPQVVIGSSMGGYLALLLLRHYLSAAADEAARIHRLILIAPAWDMTHELMLKRFPPEALTALEKQGVWHRPSQYGEPYPITRRLIEDGGRHLLGAEPWDPGRPVHIIHGRCDADVPFSHSERLMGILSGPCVRLTEVQDGEHRLSRPQDLDLLVEAVEAAVADHA